MKNPIFCSLFVLSFVFIVGCGPSGPKTYPISGTVTYNGQPVPSGSIIFTPDAAKSNPGKQLVVSIENGNYTSGKDGLIGGPMQVEISGTHNVKDTPEGRLGESLFSGFTERYDAPKETSTKNFDVKGPEVKIVP